jgi:hypothetical protein
MKFLAFFTLFVGALGYKVETVNTMCFFVNAECHKYHATFVEFAINQGSVYISHSTTATKVGMHTLIVYK